MPRQRPSAISRVPVAPAIKRTKIERPLDLVMSTPTLLLNVREARPLQALALLRANLPKDEEGLQMWRHSARIAAVMSSCPRSRASFKSGVRHWLAYVELVCGEEQAAEAAFPPALIDVLGWSNTFRCIGTFANYLGHLRGACLALGFDAPPVGHQALRRAMRGIANRQLHEARPKMFLKKSACFRVCVSPPLWSMPVVCVLQDHGNKHGVGCAAGPGGADLCDAVASLVCVPAEAAI